MGPELLDYEPSRVEGLAPRRPLAELLGSWDRLPPSGSWLRVTSALAVGILVALGALWALTLFSRILAVVVLGIAIAQALVPAVSWLNRYMPRLPAVLLVYLALAMVFGGLAYFAVPQFVNQAQAFGEAVPGFVDIVQEFLETRGVELGADLVGSVASQVANLGGTLVSGARGLSAAILDAVVVFFVSIYWLLETPRIWGFYLSLFPEARRERVIDVTRGMGMAMGGYVRGAAIDGAIVAIIFYIGYTIIGLDFRLVLALLAGMMEFVPVVGPFIAAVPAVLAGLLQSFTTGLIVLAFILIVQQIESNILVPNIMRSQADIPPLLSIVALLAGAGVGGLLGALVAIPLAAATKVVVCKVIAPGVRTWTGADRTEVVSEEPSEG